MTKNNLDLGWCQGYMALLYHMEDAYIENGLNPIQYELTASPSKAIFSKTYYNELNELPNDKIHDFCFIGSMQSNYEGRKWVIDFAKKYFTSKSIFINTDNDTNWQLLGDFDLTKENKGYNPKLCIDNQSRYAQYRHIHENIFYFQSMKQSKFVLCPAGDAPWSFRFYEVLMCKSLPIVESWHHTYRTIEEAELDYQYLLADNITNFDDNNYESMIQKNTDIFELHHLL